MMTSLGAIMMVTILWGIKSLNPIKVSMGVLVTSTLMFFFMSLSTGMTWFSMILIMLFMGGILMMFMILASILPNEKSMKTKNMYMIIGMMLCASSISGSSGSVESVSFNSKSFLMSSINFFFMMSIVLFYFLGSMSILSAEQTPMRSITCHQALIL